MKKMMTLIVLLIVICGCSSETTYTYKYQESNALNPLRGIAVWNTSKELPFPTTLEYLPVKLDSLYTESGEFDFSTLEANLNKIASRGNHVILRIVCYEPPESYIPQYYIDRGVNIVNNEFVFNEPLLITLFEELIAEFGKRYDGDHRIGFIQLGLMGRWGEWNYSGDYLEEYRPTSSQYNQIYKAYDEAFNITKLMARNPNLGNPVNYSIGFHDDSFMTSTLGSGGGDFKYLIEKGNISLDLYKTQAFGAELSGVENGDFFSTKDKQTRFINSVKYMNTSFMMWQKYDQIINTPLMEQKDLFIKLSRELGYELSVTSVKKKINDNNLEIQIYIKNTKNAPFYYDWEGEIIIGEVSFKKVLELHKIIPNETEVFTFNISLDEIQNNSSVYFRIINPLSYEYPNAKKFYLANKNLEDDLLKLFVFKK